MKQSISFTEGPVARQLYKLALPGAWGMLATLSYNTADTFFVGQLGSEPLAAMSFTFPLALIMACMGIGFATGAASKVARLVGQQLTADARSTASNAILLVILVSSLVTLTCWFFTEDIFRLLGADPSLMPLIGEYIYIWYLNVPLLMITMTFTALMQSTGHNTTAGLLMVLTALCNVILDPLLIFGLAGIPELGIAGAAWATLISRALQVATAVYLFSTRLPLWGRPNTVLGPLTQSWAAILHVGLPAMASNMIMPLASSITLALVANYGSDAVAGLGVAMRVEPLILIPFIALNAVLAPFMGQNMATRYRHRQWQALRLNVWFSFAYGMTCAAILWWLGGYIGRFFSDSESVSQIVALYFMIIPISYCLSGLGMCITACFNGLGKPMPGMMISLLRSIVLYVPMILIGEHFWGLRGLFVATALANVLAGIIGLWWIKQVLHPVKTSPAPSIPSGAGSESTDACGDGTGSA